MAEFKSFFFGTFLLLILSACGDSKPASATEANVTASNKIKTLSKNSTTSTNNAKAVVISGKDVTTKSGGEFCINVEVANFVDVVSMQFSTNWDTKALQYKGTKNFVLKFLSKENFGRAKGEESTLRFSWHAKDIKGVSLFDGATIYQTCFKAIGKSGTTTEIDFANEPMIAEIANSKMKPMKTDLQSVKVTIE